MKNSSQALDPEPLNTSDKRGGVSARTVEELIDRGVLSNSDQAALESVASRFAIAVSPAMLDLIDPANPEDPIALQFIPAAAELDNYDGALKDPIGDEHHSPVPGIVHRYPDRLLLLPLRVCAVYCRFCFRRETIGPKTTALLSDAELETALNYIRSNKNVWEVILSGGDPLLLSPRRLKFIMNALDQIEHVQVVRIHTRIPVVEPSRIIHSLIKSLRIRKAVYVVLHSNHPRELTPQALAACALLIDNGVPMLSQSVLLKGVNDDTATLEKLMRAFVANRIKPYYLHHADKANGTAHFHTSLAQGQQLMRNLRGRVSGLCQPEYVLDIPGGAGKVPVGPTWVEADGKEHVIKDYQGGQHRYADTSDV